MAKRKAKKRHLRRRRSSMSGVAGGATQALSMIAGAVIGRVLQTKFADKVNPKILAGGQIVAGYALPKFIKNDFVKGIGAGMIVNGGVSALQSFGVIGAINGVGADVQVDYLGEDDTMNGSGTIQEIAGGLDDMGLMDEGIMSGSSDISILAGDDFDY